MVVWWVGAILGGISCSLFSRDVQKFFSLILRQLVTFFVNNFLTFSKLFLVSFFFYIYTCSFFVHGLQGLSPKGGGTVTTRDGLCHTSHLSRLRDEF